MATERRNSFVSKSGEIEANDSAKIAEPTKEPGAVGAGTVGDAGLRASGCAAKTDMELADVLARECGFIGATTQESGPEPRQESIRPKR